MIKWLLLGPILVLFTVINIILGCYAAIRLGYGPPNWKTALNLVIRITALQDRLNAARDWIDKKAPWTEKYFNRCRIPKPIILVEAPDEEEEKKKEEEGTTDNAADGGTSDEADAEQAEQPAGGQSDEPQPSDAVPEPTTPPAAKGV